MDANKQPHDEGIEQAVLGAMLVDGQKCIGDIISLFKSENVFYNSKHQVIYLAMVSLFNESKNIDLLTLIDKLREQKKLHLAGQEFYIIELTQKVSSSAHYQAHCHILTQFYIKRRIIEIFSQTIQTSYEDDSNPFELLNHAYRQLDIISDWLSIKPSKDFKDHVDELFNDGRENGVCSVPVALKKMQKKLNGYQNSDLIILAARPAMGKTAYLLNDALFQAQKGIPVAVFSLEMSARQCTARLMANYAKIDANNLALGNLLDDDIHKMIYARETFSKLPIYIEDEPAISPLTLKIKTKKLVRDKGVKVIYIDYLQLMNTSGKGKNREQEISEISRGLKALAKELNVPIVALSQLSRSVENRSGHKRPMLSDLRESGAIEQDADIVMFLYRPEYYGITQWDDEEGTPTEGQVEVIVGKFRNGMVGATVVNCNLKYMEFSDIENTSNKIQAKKPEFKPLPMINTHQAFNNDVPF
ncbi:replicative DNA helicase [Capnocytophaga catalasegens]|uniref:Replicative DNA helicase n=1 Tax=Capnocytophaga catalasegens TaxID=1004260 RepID=A0AAV5AWY5_9FLAO|nr:replicative DNA helicase [Capnocytophaga catalasegens]GIZ15527.1 replicative DNA helicase [Capnocytophaga catalasegens]GJM49870.1 replicative DNA helicase [Capnocytophaga catalasegens]GJM54042.1 replicative DNA helicase [Capnocytophaga catalasegens]